MGGNKKRIGETGEVVVLSKLLPRGSISKPDMPHRPAWAVKRPAGSKLSLWLRHGLSISDFTELSVIMEVPESPPSFAKSVDSLKASSITSSSNKTTTPFCFHFWFPRNFFNISQLEHSCTSWWIPLIFWTILQCKVVMLACCARETISMIKLKQNLNRTYKPKCLSVLNFFE